MLWDLKNCFGSIELVLVVYNVGLGVVMKYNGILLYFEM